MRGLPLEARQRGMASKCDGRMSCHGLLNSRGFVVPETMTPPVPVPTAKACELQKRNFTRYFTSHPEKKTNSITEIKIQGK